MSDIIPSDQELVKKAICDPKAYSDIVSRYEQPLLRYIRRLGCQNADDAKDILQETFIKIYEYLNDYDSSFLFSSWAYRIAHNETMNFFRKSRSVPRVAVTEEELSMFEQIRNDVDIAGDFARAMENECLQKALSTLDEKYRHALILRFIEGKSYSEISDIMSIPSGTVATLISRGKTKLKSILEHIRVRL